MNGTEERDPAARRLLTALAARYEPPEEAFVPPPPYAARHRKTGTWPRKALAARFLSVTRRGGHR